MQPELDRYIRRCQTA